MTRGSKQGEHRGGRKKGTPNKATQDVMAKLQALDCDPIEGMARIIKGDLICPECLGEGRQKYSAGMHGLYVDIDGGTERTCRLCMGTKKEPVPIKIRAEMNKELAQYVAPKRKAIEHSGPNGGPIESEEAVGDLSDAELEARINELHGKTGKD